MADVKAPAPVGVKVDVIQKGKEEFVLKVTKDKQTAEVPLQGVKTLKDAEAVKTALLAEIDKAAVQQGTKPEGVGTKMDKAV